MSTTVPLPVCPECHKTMRLLLEKQTGGRKMRCIDCGQPDPMKSADARAWLKGELGA